MSQVSDVVCIYYHYTHEVVGLVGGCSLGLFGGLHALNCMSKESKCPHYNNGKTKRETLTEFDIPITPMSRGQRQSG